MNGDRPGKPAGRIADNSHRWPELAGLLAGGAGCDCQMLAVTLAEGMAIAQRVQPQTVPGVSPKH